MSALTATYSPLTQQSLNDALHMTFYDFSIGNIFFGLDFLSISLYIAFTGAGIAFGTYLVHASFQLLLHPLPSHRRSVRRALRLMLASLSASVVMMPVCSFYGYLADARLAEQTFTNKAAFELDELSTSTVRRISEEEQSGHWWADPRDSSNVTDIKIALREGTIGGRSTLQELMQRRLQHPFEPHHPIQ